MSSDQRYVQCLEIDLYTANQFNNNLTRTSEMLSHNPHAAVLRNTAMLERVRAFDHVLFP